VRGFADDDFSLRLHVTGGDEIADLVTVYNDIGDVLRDQRNESVQRELLFETVLQASPLPIILTSDRGRIVFVNRAARDLFGGGSGSKGGSSRSWPERCRQSRRRSMPARARSSRSTARRFN
jgi:two-component system, NtrC family, nitrogen regulation sensor histidine kinase NtrY